MRNEMKLIGQMKYIERDTTTFPSTLSLVHSVEITVLSSSMITIIINIYKAAYRLKGVAGKNPVHHCWPAVWPRIN